MVNETCQTFSKKQDLTEFLQRPAVFERGENILHAVEQVCCVGREVVSLLFPSICLTSLVRHFAARRFHEQEPSASRNLAEYYAFELVAAETTSAGATSTGGVYTAIPLALRIKVGDGSWESSLIQPGVAREGEPHDMVAFDIVIAWNNS